MEKSTGQLSRGYAAVFGTVAIWSLPSLFLFYLNRFYDPWSQNFYRYAVACLAIVPFVLFQFRRGPKIDIRAVGLCLMLNWAAATEPKSTPEVRLYLACS